MWRLCASALLMCALVCARHDDDFAFDTSEEYRAEISNKTEVTNGLKRLWGIPDATAYVGRLFRMEIPKEAFSGEVVAYKVRGADGRRAPPWLAVDSRHGLLSGVPLAQDEGAYALTVTAHAHGDLATDSFNIEVKSSRARSYSRYGACGAGDSRLSVQLLLDARLHLMKPKQRTQALMNLATFMALDGEEFLIESVKPSGRQTHQTVLQSGPGSQRRRGDAATTAVYFNVGCAGKLWARQRVLAAALGAQARDGTLAHLLQVGVLGWRLLAEAPAVPASLAAPRPRRQIPHGQTDYGSGEYDDEYDDEGDDYSGDGDDDYSFEPGPDVAPNKPLEIVPTQDMAESSNSASTAIPRMIRPSVFSGSSVEPTVDIVPMQATTTTEKMPIIEASSDVQSSTTAVPSSQLTTVAVSSTTVTTTTVAPPTTITTTATETVEETTKQEVPPTEKTSTMIEGKTTETIEDFGLTPPSVRLPTLPPNHPPQLSYHMKKLAITAGKAFRYLIPSDLFSDAEDATNLTYSMFEADGAPLKPSSWVQFVPESREVYGLPLEQHVSRWGFTVQATDSGGAAARAPLDIIVQHHKGQRAINHQFTITLKLQSKPRYAIDWQIDVLEGLVNLFRTRDMEHIIVRDVTSSDDLLSFSWSDDTLAKDSCATDDIERIMKILESDTTKGSPSANLSRVMQPALKVSSVSWEGLGACAATPPPPAPPRLDNFPPMPRNQVDLVQATAGHLLVFKVPEDTFYDPEDGGTRRLRLNVVRGDRSPLPGGHWLQFDTANQEFYGLPTDRDVGRREYQLIAEDSTGKTSNDVLIVEVNHAPPIQPPVEFQMTMNYPYSELAGSALNKRTFLESLAKLFGDKDASAIRVKSITDKPTTVVWYNTSLPMDRCPSDEIEQLKRLMIKEEAGAPESLTERVDQALDRHHVMSIRLARRGACALPATVLRGPSVSGAAEGSAGGAGAGGGLREYLVTFIVPGVVIVAIILVAAVIACVLYRRRTGKMSVGDEEERQAFRSKGIPVIFQDELDEKPDPGNKSPVIMKEEKPPLLPPPDYNPDSPTPSHTPYRPPPPFTRDPRGNTRPKPTPTYRKPPPYVPP